MNTPSNAAQIVTSGRTILILDSSPYTFPVLRAALGLRRTDEGMESTAALTAVTALLVGRLL